MNKVLILVLIVIDATLAISNSNNKFLVKNKNYEILTLNNVNDVYNSQVQPEMVINNNY